MSEDKLPTATSGDPAGDPAGADAGDDDLLRRAAREVRASPSLQALVPLSASEREQLADAAIARVLGVAGAPAPSREPLSPRAPSPRSPAEIVPLRRSRSGARAVGVAIAATLALAAAVALYLAAGGRSVAPLAAYAMVVEGEQDTRGAAGSGAHAGPVKLRPETRLVVTLTPRQPERDTRLRLVLVRQDRATLLETSITQGKAGSFAIEGPAAEVLGVQADGPAELVVMLGRELPGDDQLRALALRASGEAPRHLQVLRQGLVLEGFSHAAIDVLLGGCSAVLDAAGAPGGALPRCEVAAGARLQLWVGVPATAAVAIAIDGRALGQKPAARGGGSAFDLDVPAHAGLLSVRMEASQIAAWQITPAASFAQVRASDEARIAGRLEEAAADLDAIPLGASPEEQLEAVRRRAKIARARGQVEEERARRRQAVALARALGRVSVESDETVAILHGFIDEHALTQAVQLLPALDAHGMVYAEGAEDREFLRGLLASELGDLGAALGSFQRALTTTERIGDAAGRATILGSLADVLQSLGRDREAFAFIDAEIQRGAQDADVCARVDALTTAGWLLRDTDLPRAQRLADRAAALAGESCGRLVPITLVNQGWLLAAARRFGDARAVLSRIAKVQGARDGRVTTWALRLEAEIVLGEDPAGAAQHAQHLAARAAELCSTELLYEAHLLRARALVLLDRPAQAAAAFVEAEHALTVWSRLVPLGEGRETFFQRHDQLALTAIPFFLAQARRGQPGAGLALATTVRHSIARFVTSLARGGRARARVERGETARDHTSRQFERTLDRWPASLGAQAHLAEAVADVCEARDAAARAGDEPALAEPPAHAGLFVHPSPQGLLVLAWRGSSIDFRELPRAGSHERLDELSARIARAAAPMLAGAPRVHLYVHRSLVALPLDRSLAALLEVPIAFAVDAPPRPSDASCTGARRALLVTNPQRNLWAASEAARAIEGDLARMGFRVDTLEGAAATRAAVEQRLADPCTALFQYDGHGIAGARRGASGGLTRDRTDDALLLAGGDTLTAADVLGRIRVPQAVVLNGCTTAAPEGLGLAQAFLLAGSSQVVASLDVIPADDAAKFTRRLFEGPPFRTAATAATAAIDLVPLYARAMAGADLPALRVFER
jgi:tetratricopeptide (TPR) repeat protein